MPVLLDRSTVAERVPELLHELAGPDAVPRPDQLTAISAVAADGGRVLVVQRTGWGKSAVYFLATRLLRDAGAGPTFLISPLRRYPSRKDYDNILCLAWRGFTGVLNDAPFQMHYTGLDRDARYKVRWVYSNEQLDVKVRLDAGNET